MFWAMCFGNVPAIPFVWNILVLPFVIFCGLFWDVELTFVILMAIPAGNVWFFYYNGWHDKCLYFSSICFLRPP